MNNVSYVLNENILGIVSRLLNTNQMLGDFLERVTGISMYLNTYAKIFETERIWDQQRRITV